MTGADPTTYTFAVPLLLAASYLLGSVPFGVVITRALGLGDLRKIGSGNIGATNVLRTGNKGAALATLLLDSGKGAMAVILAYALGIDFAAPYAGLAAFLGHLYSAFLGFKGGKGVATYLGTLLAIAPLAGLLACADDPHFLRLGAGGLGAGAGLAVGGRSAGGDTGGAGDDGAHMVETPGQSGAPARRHRAENLFAFKPQIGDESVWRTRGMPASP